MVKDSPFTVAVRTYRITPRQKTTQDEMRPNRRPIMSDTGAAVRAPKKVPAERMETISAD